MSPSCLRSTDSGRGAQPTRWGKGSPGNARCWDRARQATGSQLQHQQHKQPEKKQINRTLSRKRTTTHRKPTKSLCIFRYVVRDLYLECITNS